MKVSELIQELSKQDPDIQVIRSIPMTEGVHTEPIEFVQCYDTDIGEVVVIY